MAELVDAPDSKSGSFGSEGSTPSPGTTVILNSNPLLHSRQGSLTLRVVRFSLREPGLVVALAPRNDPLSRYHAHGMVPDLILNNWHLP